jgi:hypothetical protein
MGTGDLADNRRRREEEAIEIRKLYRDSQLTRRRRLVEFSFDSVVPPESGNYDIGFTRCAFPKGITDIIIDLSSPDPLTVSESAVMLRRLLSSDKNPPINEVIEAGLLPRLRELLLDFTRPSLQLEVCWVLTNICSGSSEQTQAVVECGVIPILVRILSSQDETLQEQALWAIANIAGDRAEFRDFCLSAGITEPLVSILGKSIRLKSTQAIRLAVWVASNLCRGQPAPCFEALLPVLQLLGRCFAISNDSEVLADTAWALNYLTEEADQYRMGSIIRFFDINRMSMLLGHPSSTVHTPMLRVVGNLVSGPSDVTQALVEAGVLGRLNSLSFSHKKAVRKESLWAISNICADSEVMLQAVIDAGLMGCICDILRNGSVDFEERREAVWTLCNAATVGSRNQKLTLVLRDGFRVLELLSDYLGVCRDIAVLRSVLDAIYALLDAGDEANDLNPFCHIIEECGGLDLIESLQEYESAEVYASAVRILERFFECREPPIEYSKKSSPSRQPGMPILPFTRSG